MVDDLVCQCTSFVAHVCHLVAPFPGLHMGCFVCHLVAPSLSLRWYACVPPGCSPPCWHAYSLLVVLHERWHWQCGALVQDGHVVLTGLVKLSCCIHVSFCPTHPHHYCMSVPLRVYSPVQLQPHWSALLSFALGWLCCTLPIALAVALW